MSTASSIQGTWYCASSSLTCHSTLFFLSPLHLQEESTLFKATASSDTLPGNMASMDPMSKKLLPSMSCQKESSISWWDMSRRSFTPRNRSAMLKCRSSWLRPSPNMLLISNVHLSTTTVAMVLYPSSFCKQGLHDSSWRFLCWGQGVLCRLVLFRHCQDDARLWQGHLDEASCFACWVVQQSQWPPKHQEVLCFWTLQDSVKY